MGAVGYTGGDPNKVDVAGDTMTGPLVLPGDPSSDLQAATKAYVDANSGGGGGGGGVPSGTVVTETTFGQASSAGVATAYSRGDHTHGTPTAPTATSVGADPLGAASTAQANAATYTDSQVATKPSLSSTSPTDGTITAVGAVGIGTTAARADHQHGGPGFGSVTAQTSFGAASADGVASSVARSDHSHGTPAAPSVPTASGTVAAETSYGIVSAAGAAATFSRGDHTHGSPSLASTAPTTSAVGDAAATGVGAAPARADHTHGREAFGAVTAQTSFGLSAANGSATTVAHSDHTHGTPAAPSVPSAAATVAAETSYGVASAVGVATTYARGDHTHGSPSLGTTSTTAAAGDHTHASAYQPLDADLTTIAGLTPTTDNIIQSVAGAWASRTPTQVKTALAIAESDVANLTTDLSAKAPLASPTFTGTPAAPTAAQGTNTTQLATTAFVQTAAGLLVPKSLFTTKGDLVAATASGAVARVGVGTDGQVLTADSAQATGVSWQAAGGGGGTDYKVASKPISGKWYRAPGFGPVGSNLTMTLNNLYLVPFRLAATTTFDRMGIDVATAGGGTSVCRLGIFASDASGNLPGTLILDAGTVSVSTTGGKTVTISQALSAGVYWLGVALQVATGAVIRATTSYDPLLYYSSGANMFTGSTAPGGMFATGITGAFASNPTISDNDNGPIIGMRAV